MDITLKRLLGLEDEGKRTYRFVSGEVTQEEFEYCQLLDALVFGEGGYVETLGPTWALIHDPRFVKIENAFIVNRRAVFGGDAMVGKQYISSDGTFTSTIADLEQYAETLGEGRYFYTLISHPDKLCPLRNWYLRIFPDMVHKEGLEIPTAHTDLQCECSLVAQDAREVKNWPDEDLWKLIKEECPNYFNQVGTPNGVAIRLFDLFRADLLGLIADYAITPISDVYIELDTGDVLGKTAYEETGAAPPHVFLEVDILERALTQRAVLRATAAKILRQLGFQTILRDMFNNEIKLTDIERDELLRVVYSPKRIGDVVYDPGTSWYGYLNIVKGEIIEFLLNIKESGKPVEVREREQLSRASEVAHEKFLRLEAGEDQIINQFTEPEVDVQMDSHAEMMQTILKNPLKQELFMWWAEAERRSNDDNKDNTDRLNMHRLYSILTPVFTDPDFAINEYTYADYAAEAENLGLFTVGTTEVEGEYHGTFDEED